MADDRAERKDQATHEPTPVRLRQAQRRGIVPRSAELTSAASLVAALAALALLGGGLVGDLTALTAAMLRPPAGAAPAAGLVGAAAPAALRVFGVLGAAALAAAVAGAVQVRGAVAAGRLAPQAGRVNPAGGVRRLFSAVAAARAGRTVAKLGLVAGAAWAVLGPLMGRLAAAGEMPPGVLAGELARLARRLAGWTAAGLLAVGAADYGWQWWRHRRELRMTRRERLDELRRTEGDPLVRRRRRERARQMSRRRAGETTAR